MIGKTHTQETKDKISNTKTDGSNSVICLETGIEYPSPTKASQETGIDKSSISRCCRGISLTAGGYKWRYTNPEKYEQFKDIVDNRVDRSKRKVQCIETGEIFDTATAAANFANADVTNIVKACRGKICTSKGYHWKYVS